MNTRIKKAGFSLVELVIVIVIIGVIAAIAVPRISRGAAGAGQSALRADLHVLRNALDMYAAEHDGVYPLATTFSNQLTMYTDDIGGTNSIRTSQFKYGPYLIAVPPLKVGDGKGQTGVAALVGATIGWIYLEGTGQINANSGTTAKDDAGVLFSTY